MRPGPYSLQRIVGASPAITALRHLVARVAVSPASTVLLTGESGTGKDLVAKVIHYASDRVVEAVHEHHVLGASGAIARERALRPRARRVHRRAHAEEGTARDRGWRDRVPRRDRRDDPRRFKPSCCGFSRRRASGASADRRIFVSTFASSPRPTAISRRRSRNISSGPTSSSV